MSSFVGTAVPHRFAARRRGAQLHHVHARADLAAHGPGRDAKACKHLSLALGRSTAVAAHGRDDEGRSALGLDVVDDGLGDDVTVANASATSRNGDLHARLDLFVKLGLGELAIHDRRYVLGSDGLARERLARIEHLRNLDILEESRDISTLDDLHDALLFFSPPTALTWPPVDPRRAETGPQFATPILLLSKAFGCGTQIIDWVWFAGSCVPQAMG